LTMIATAVFAVCLSLPLATALAEPIELPNGGTR
jgi:hypothetical protein